LTRYPAPLEQQFAKTIRDLRDRITVLEQRTNTLGTGSGGAAAFPSVTVAGPNGTLTLAQNPSLPSPGTSSPATIFSDGQGSSASAPQLYSHEVTAGANQPFEEMVLAGPRSSADTQLSAASVLLDGGGTGANAARGSLGWVQNVGAAALANLTWDQWGLTTQQPASGSAAAGGALVTGSAVQNDVAPASGSSAKFVRMGTFSGTTDGSGNLAVSGLALGFTPTGVVVQRNGGTGPAGVVCKSASSLSSSGFSTYWDNGGAAYASSAVVGWFLAFG